MANICAIRVANWIKFDTNCLLITPTLPPPSHSHIYMSISPLSLLFWLYQSLGFVYNRVISCSLTLDKDTARQTGVSRDHLRAAWTYVQLNTNYVCNVKMMQIVCDNKNMVFMLHLKYGKNFMI